MSPLSIVGDFSVSDAFGVAWPVVSGILPSPARMFGATFSAGAFCCAAGAGVGDSFFFISWADAAPAANNNAAATVDNNLTLFMAHASSGYPPCKNVAGIRQFHG